MKFIYLLLAIITTIHAQSCTRDYDCGSIPYRLCSGGEDDCKSTVSGFSISNGFIYYAQICRTSSVISNTTFKKISIGGSAPTTIASITTGYPYGNVVKFLGLLGNKLSYYTTARAPGVLLRSLDINTKEVLPVLNDNVTPLGLFAFDFTSHMESTYFCNMRISGSSYFHTVERHNLLPSSEEGFDSDALLYVLPHGQYCGQMRTNGANELYFMGIETMYNATAQTSMSTIYRGSTSCSNCSATSATRVFSFNEEIFDFRVSNDIIYFGTSSGIYRVDTNGANYWKITSEFARNLDVIGFTIYFNTELAIKSISIVGASGKSTQLNQPPTGSCVCRSAFTGANCQSCKGQVQWDYLNLPNCIPTDANGVPASCLQDYQCGNPPFTVCYGTCHCRGNFYGSKCDQCAPPRKVSWNSFGIPSCEV